MSKNRTLSMAMKLYDCHIGGNESFSARRMFFLLFSMENKLLSLGGVKCQVKSRQLLCAYLAPYTCTQ